MGTATLSTSDAERSLAKQFEEVAARVPDHPAFRDGAIEWSYSELDRRSNALARNLLKIIGPETEPVVLLLESPGLMVLSQLATLKAGKICVPVDFDFPAERKNLILSDTGSRLVLTQEAEEENVSAIAGGRKLLAVDEASAGSSNRPVATDVDPGQTAYILYTSGSTGVPKGVMQSHRSLGWLACLHRHSLGTGIGDRLTTPNSLTYTGGLWALLGSLLNGATLVRSRFEAPAPFLATLFAQRVTIAQLMPTTLRQLLATAETRIDLPHLRQVFTGGETLYPEDVRAFAELFPQGCKLYYDFGSTEAGLVAGSYVDLSVGGAAGQLPIGPPADGMEVVLLDDEKRQVGAREQGEIAVRGPSLAQGYWREPELTAQRFVTSADGERTYLTGDLGELLPDGSLLHCGRKDFEVKVRGYRINLEEIESTLRSLEGIDDAAVTAPESGRGERRLVAYVRTDTETEASVGRLREQLQERLPGYMIPAFFIRLDRFPLTGNGKLDRQALPVSDGSRPELDTPWVAPSTANESTICGLLSDVLEIQPVGAQDNLFELGADSLSIFRFLDLVRKELDVEIEATAVFNAPTARQLARMIERVHTPPPRPG